MFVHNADTFRVMQQRTWLNVVFAISGWEYHTLLAEHRQKLLLKQDSLIQAKQADSLKQEAIIAQEHAKSQAAADSLKSANYGIKVLNKRVAYLTAGRKWRNWLIGVSVMFNVALAATVAVTVK